MFRCAIYHLQGDTSISAQNHTFFKILLSMVTCVIEYFTMLCTITEIRYYSNLQNGESTVKTQLYLLAMSGWVT